MSNKSSLVMANIHSLEGHINQRGRLHLLESKLSLEVESLISGAGQRHVCKDYFRRQNCLQVAIHNANSQLGHRRVVWEMPSPIDVNIHSASWKPFLSDGVLLIEVWDELLRHFGFRRSRRSQTWLRQ